MAFVRQSLLVARPVVRRQGVSLILKQAQFATAGGITVEQNKIPVLFDRLLVVQRKGKTTVRYFCWMTPQGFTQSGLKSRSYPLFDKLVPAQIAPKQGYPLACKNYLPGSHTPNFPKFLAAPRENFPLALQPVDADQYDAREWAQHCRSVLDEELPKHGVVLFRGLPFNGDQFVTFIQSLGYPPMGYDGGSGSKPFFNEDAAVVIPSEHRQLNVEPHNEMAYWHKYPRKVFFYCLDPAKEGCGGLTPVVSNTEVLAKMDPKVLQKFREKKIRYIRTLDHEDKTHIDKCYSWQNVLQTKSRTIVEEILNYYKVSYEWNESDGSIYWEYNLPAFITHPETGKEVFFNQVDTHHSSYLKNSPYLQGMVLDDHKCPTHTTYGDGEEIEPEVLDHIRATKWACAVAFQWKEGDFMVIDNFDAMHARLSFVVKRKMLAYLSPI